MLVEKYRDYVLPHVPAELVKVVDLFGQEENKDPYAEAHLLNGYEKIFFNVQRAAIEGSGVWVVNDMQLARKALKLPNLFSSERTTNFAKMIGADFPLVPIEIDPPSHSNFRRVLNSEFSHSSVARLEPAIRLRAAELLHGIAPSGSCEFIDAFANPFSMSIFLELIGLPIKDIESIVDWEKGLLHSDNRLHRMRAARAIVRYMDDFISSKRRNLGDDLVSRLLSTKIDEKPISNSDLRSICVMLFVAGLDTVSASLGLIFRYLATDGRPLQDRLRVSPELIPASIEEILRRFSVINDRCRLVSADTDILGVDMKRGDRVLFATSILNLSDFVFDDAMTVDIARDNRVTSSFFFGPHRCLGRHLARVELRVAVEEWLRSIPHWSSKQGICPPINARSGVFCVDELELQWSAPQADLAGIKPRPQCENLSI